MIAHEDNDQQGQRADNGDCTCVAMSETTRVAANAHSRNGGSSFALFAAYKELPMSIRYYARRHSARRAEHLRAASCHSSRLRIGQVTMPHADSYGCCGHLSDMPGSATDTGSEQEHQETLQ